MVLSYSTLCSTYVNFTTRRFVLWCLGLNYFVSTTSVSLFVRLSNVIVVVAVFYPVDRQSSYFVFTDRVISPHQLRIPMLSCDVCISIGKSLLASSSVLA